MNRRTHGWFSLFAVCFLIFGPAAIRGSAEIDRHKPSAIETTGVPVVPDDLVIELNKYQNIRSAGLAGWSPTGDGILVRTRFANTTQLHRVFSPGGRREQITFDKEPVRGQFVEHSDDGAMLLAKSVGGNEQNQVFAFDPSQHQIAMLTDGKSRNNLGPFSPDGRQVLVHSTARNGRDTDMYVTDCRSAGSMEMLLATDNEYWYSADWSHDGKKILMGQYVSANESYGGIFDLETRSLTRLFLPGQTAPGTAGGTKVSIGPARFAPDGRSVYLATDLAGEFNQLASFDIVTKELTWVTADIPWDVEELEVHQPTGRVAFTVNNDGASQLYVIDGGKRRAIDLPLAIINSIQFSPDGGALGMTLSPPDGTSDVFTVDLASDELSRWTYSELGGLDATKFIRPERIRFPTFDDREIAAYYYRPETATGAEKVPVIISIHGGPEGQYRPYFSATAQLYAGKMGIAYIAPNVRGSAGYGKTFLKLDNAAKREDSVRDIGALLDWIRKRPELDEDRVLVMGGSYGGYMVLASLTHYPDRIVAGIDIVGIANFISFLKKTKPYRRQLRRAEYGDETDPAMRAVFERINPTASADKIRSALLVVHGKNDPRVPFFEAQQIADKVRGNEIPVWTVYADNEGHGFRKKDNRDYNRAVEVMFVKQYLLE